MIDFTRSFQPEEPDLPKEEYDLQGQLIDTVLDVHADIGVVSGVVDVFSTVFRIFT